MEKNKPFGSSVLKLGGVYQLRDFGAQRAHTSPDHDLCCLRGVQVDQSGTILFGVAFKATPEQGIPCDTAGFALEPSCWCSSNSLR